MDRISRWRISKIEQVISAAQEERAEKLEQWYKDKSLQAQRHATAVAAIVLAGNPKINEPLIRAWERALCHFKISVKEPGRMEDQVWAAVQLIPIIIGREEFAAKFAEIFRTAPSWLLQFTRVLVDALLCVWPAALRGSSHSVRAATRYRPQGIG